jgi:UDP-N-acetylglucosamine--N-acetylmuramyl-(pentapeptide) pyrophosphoryl-undecaprenol N-acetylglucosamine transferase
MLLGKGGALSIPVCLAAKRRGIPIVLHESDAVVGRANRFLSHFAETVCLGFPSGEGRRVKEYRQRTVVTGNPVRPEITRGSREEGLRITGFSGKRPVLLIVGGSQGAQALNEIVVQKLSELATLCDIVHIAGKGKTRGAPQQSYFAIEFANEELPHLYALASLAISRAGAGSLSELAANGIPTILVPLRGVAHDHQGVNAERAQESGGCILIEQEGLPRALVPLVRELLADRGRLHALAEKIRTLNRQDAATNIARMLLDLCM